MKGKIRTREKCPNCKQCFQIVKDDQDSSEEKGIHCPKCQTRPNTYFIVFYWEKAKRRISRDTDGHILDSYKRARRLLESIRKDIDDGIFSLTDYLPREIEQFRANRLLNRWIEFKESEGLARSHLREVKRYVKLYFGPFLKDMDVRKLRTLHVDDLFMSLPEIQRAQDLKPLSDKTKKNIMTMFRNFCNWLFKRELLLRMPQFPLITPSEPPIEWITRQDQERILDYITEHHRPIFKFMMRHPVRSGEACALQHEHFNLDNMTVHICQAFSLGEIRPRKNKKPYRLPLAQEFDVNILRDKLPKAYVFTNTRGNPYSSNDLRKIWKRARDKAGVSIKLKNATRHSIASQAVNDGVDLAVVSRALGHSTLEVTKQRYANMEVQCLRAVIDGRAQVGRIHRRDE